MPYTFLFLIFSLALAAQGGACTAKQPSKASQQPTRTRQSNDNAQAQTPRGTPDATPPQQDAGREDDKPMDANRLATGMWGGEQVTLKVSDAGAQIEFACAHGTIEGPLGLTGGGFEAKGTFVTERGFVRPDGDKRSGTPARYAGRVDGETLTLKVSYEGSSEEIGTYILKHGQQVRLFKCK